MPEPTASGRSRATIAAIALTAVAAAGIGLHFVTRDPEPPPPVALDSNAPPAGPAPAIAGPWRVIVLPLGVPGSEGPDTAAAFAHALAARLALGEEVTASALEDREVAPGTAPTWSDGVSAAREADATHFVVGAIEATGATRRVRATLHHRGGAVVRSADAGASRDGLLETIPALGDTLLGERAPAGELADRGLASTSASLDAMLAFVRGRRAAAEGDDEAAASAFADAFAADDAFSLAALRRAEALERLGRIEAASASLSAALANRDRLAPADIVRAEARLAEWQGQYGRAVALLRVHTLEHPDDVEAWRRLAEIQARLGPITGRPPQDALNPLERLLERAPHDRAALELAMALTADGGDLEAIGAFVERFEEAERPPYALAAAIARGDEDAIRAAGDVTVPTLLLRSLPELRGHAWLAARGDDLAGALPFAEHALAHGRPAAAVERLESVWSSLPRFEAERALGLLILPPLAVPDAALARLCERADEASAEADGDDPHAADRAQIRVFLSAACAHRAGRADEASGAIAALRAETGPRAPIAAMLAAQLEAWLALDGGAPERAIELLDAAAVELPPRRVERSPILAGTLGRWVRTEALLRLDRLPEALHFAQSLPHPAGASRALAAIALRRAGDVYREAERAYEMQLTYERFLRYRAECDAALEAERDEVQGSLRAAREAAREAEHGE